MEKVIDTEILLSYVRTNGLSQQFSKFFESFNIPSRQKRVNMTFIRLESLCRKLNKKEQKEDFQQAKKKNIEWKKGEYKLFLWVSAFYMHTHQLTSFQMNQEDYQFLKTIFLTKTPQRLQYQLSYLYCQEKKAWTPQETELFQKIINHESTLSQTLEWKNIAYKLFLESNGTYFKTFGQCRQMWSNHLDPNVNKKHWTASEDLLLMTLVSQQNKSWSRIAEKFKGKRTVHMVKNRYNSLLRKRERQIKKNQLKELKKAKQLAEKTEVKVQKSSKTLESEICASYPNLESIQDPLEQEFERIKTENQLFLQQNKEDVSIKERATHIPQVQQTEQGQQNSPAQYNQKWINDLIKNVKIKEISSIDKTKYYSESDLLQKLGCSHFQQVPDLLSYQEHSLGESLCSV